MGESITKLHLYTGEGKGKTTAAMGLALRALGCGWHVFVAQFLKTGRSGELDALRTFSNATVAGVEPIGKFTFKMNDKERSDAVIRQSGQIERLRTVIDEIKPQMMVFDELGMAMHMDIVNQDAAWRLIHESLKLGEVVITGRYAPEALRAQADYISEITCIAHPYKEGLRARRGIEF